MPDPNQMLYGGGAFNSQTVLQEGTAKAFQSVAQSTALAIQDAVDNLRNITTISTTAAGVAMSQMLAKPDPAHIALYKEIINNAQGMSATATQNFSQVGKNAAAILNSFQLAPPTAPGSK